MAGKTLVMKEGAKAISSYVVIAADCFIAFYWKLYRETSLFCPLRAYQGFSRPSVRCAEGSMSPKFTSVTVRSLQKNASAYPPSRRTLENRVCVTQHFFTVAGVPFHLLTLALN